MLQEGNKARRTSTYTCRTGVGTFTDSSTVTAVTVTAVTVTDVTVTAVTVTAVTVTAVTVTAVTVTAVINPESRGNSRARSPPTL